MVLNEKKCAVMSLTHSLNKVIFSYSVNDTALDRVSSIKDLGVIIDEKLSFNEHVDNVTRKAYKMLGFIFRCGKFFKNPRSMLVQFNTLVRSRLEYCSTVWNPLYVHGIDQIERVQKKFTRLHYFKFQLESPRPSYDIRLKRLRLHSLETRRMICDEVMLFKLVHQHVDTTLSRELSYH